MNFRDQVGGGDVDEVAGGDAEQGQLNAVDFLGDGDGDQGRDRTDQRPENVPGDHAAAGHAGVDHDREVADLAGNLMKKNGDGGGDADSRVDQEGGGDDGAVDEVVDGVADDVERDEVGVLVVRFVFVAVVMLKDNFFDDEEEEKPNHQPAEDGGQLIWVIFNDFGQNIEEGRTHQGAGGEADEVTGPVFHPFVLSQQ